MNLLLFSSFIVLQNSRDGVSSFLKSFSRLNYMVYDKNMETKTGNFTELNEADKKTYPRNLHEETYGHDTRIEENITENAIFLLKIQKNIYIYDLLKKLTSEWLSQNAKLKAWYLYMDYVESNEPNRTSKFAMDLTRGGLFDSFYDEFDWR